MANCPNNDEKRVICPTGDELLPQICALLPRGKAWSGADIDGTDANKFWKAISFDVAETMGRVCDMLKETRCKEADETRDQWLEDYGLPDECDPNGISLCGKVYAQGGARCEYLVEVAEEMGWVITCEDLSQTPVPMTGCWDMGCDSLPPAHETYIPGQNLGREELCVCDYGEISNHPDTHLFEDTADRTEASCEIPGSSLGCEPMGPSDQCCNFIGYYEVTATTSEDTGVSDACTGQSYNVIKNPAFPATRTVGNMPALGQNSCPSDITGAITGCTPIDFAPVGCIFPEDSDSGMYVKEYVGYAHALKITVDVPASVTLRESRNLDTVDMFMVGCTPVGCDQGLCQPEWETILCFLDRVIHAHVDVHFDAVYV